MFMKFRNGKSTSSFLDYDFNSEYFIEIQKYADTLDLDKIYETELRVILKINGSYNDT